MDTSEAVNERYWYTYTFPGLVDLRIQIDKLSRSVVFAIVNDLAVPLIIGSDHLDKFIEPVQCKTIGSRFLTVTALSYWTRSTPHV